ncbi:MAG: polysaccharide deacetylase family protein [Thermoleophilia bacterium]
MNTYTRRRLTALVVLIAVIWGLVALVRSMVGGGGGHSAARTAATPVVDTNPVTIARRAVVPVLCWHQVRALTGTESASDLTYIVTPQQLDTQLLALRRAGYTTITGEAYAAYLTTGKALPAKPILLTFDDGSAGQYTDALPLLQQHHMVATFFPMTVVLGKTNWITAQQLREIAAAGMSVGGHTWDHQNVAKLSTARDYRVQFVQPKADLQRILKKPVTLFAYPFGLWSRAAFPHLRSAGYTVAFQLSDKLYAKDPLMTVRRMIVPGWSGDELLRQIGVAFPDAPAGSGGTSTSTTTTAQ